MIQSLEELETIVIHRGAGLPDLYLDLDDAEGADVDLSSGFDTFTAAWLLNGTEQAIGTCSGTATGFKVVLPDTGLALNADEYVLRCRCERISDNRPRLAYALVQVLSY